MAQTVARLQRHALRAYDTNDTNTAAVSQRLPPRRKPKRQNKYQQFSKLQGQELDPLERMIVEAKVKNLVLQQEISMLSSNRRNKGQQHGTAIPPLTPVEYPDTKTIDPYDPTTFGYIQLGTIVGTHGVQGWCKIKASKDNINHSGMDDDDDDESSRKMSSFQRFLCTAGICHVKAPAKRAPRPITLLQGKQRGAANNCGEYLVQFQGVLDRDAAQELKGSVLYVRHEQQQQQQENAAASRRKEVEDDRQEYAVSDLVGLDVYLWQQPKQPHDEPSLSSPGNDKSFVGTVGGIVFAHDISSIALGHDFLELILPRGQVPGLLSSFRDELALIPFVPQLVPIVDVTRREIYINPPQGLLDLVYVRQDKARIKGFLPAGPVSLPPEKD
jgi:16S rRNA processing protein RimM